MTGPARRGSGTGSGPVRSPTPAGGFVDLRVRRRRGRLDLVVDLTVDPATTVAVVGPNGAGKTTLLRTVAGLGALDDGHVRVGGDTWDEPAAGRWVPPERRSVGLVFQDQVLFPHLSVADNVAFGLTSRGARRRDARGVAREWLERVGLADRADVRPAELSGGQAQRVALARALAVSPQVLALDEPLAALDADAHAEMSELLGAHLSSFRGVVLMVTHDPGEAVTRGDVVLVLEAGRITQCAPPDRLEATGYLARFLS